MKYQTEGHLSLTLITGLAAEVYGIKDLDSKQPWEFDSRDLWFGKDFDFYLDQIIDEYLDEIEVDLLSVWSTNKSEQESADASA